MGTFGRILLVVGTGSLLLAGFLLFYMWLAHQSGGWFPGLMDNLILSVAPIFAALGICGLLYGRHLVREARELCEFADAMKAAKEPRVGE
jgi:hypothetical protein